jgi:hypothetical protein
MAKAATFSVVAGTAGIVSTMRAYWATPAPPNSYREMASAMRAVLAELKSPEARDELKLLAAYYEKLAGYVATTSESVRLARTDHS